MQGVAEEEHFGKALGLAFMSSFFFFTCYLYLNEAEVRGFEGTFIRGFLHIICGHFFCMKNKKTVAFSHTQSFMTLCIRNGAMIFYATSIGVAQFYLPLPIVHTICGSGPIFVFIIDYFMNGVGINAKQFMAIVIAVAGLVLAINGSMLIKYIDPEFETHSEFENYQSENAVVATLMGVELLLANVGYGFAMVLTKRLK